MAGSGGRAASGGVAGAPKHEFKMIGGVRVRADKSELRIYQQARRVMDNVTVLKPRQGIANRSAYRVADAVFSRTNYGRPATKTRKRAVGFTSRLGRTKNPERRKRLVSLLTKARYGVGATATKDHGTGFIRYKAPKRK